MPQIEGAVAGAVREVHNRLEVIIVVTIQGVEQNYTLNISHQKHVVASYRDNAGNPPTAAVNTLVNKPAGDFRRAFEGYARLFAARILGKESTTFNPSLPANRIAVGDVIFTSDSANLGGNIHCFPFCDGPARTPSSIAMRAATYNHFKTVAAFLYRNEGPMPGARNSWQQISALVTGCRGRANTLFTNLEVAALERRLGAQLNARVRQERGAQRRAIAQAGPRENDNRPPFRGRG